MCTWIVKKFPGLPGFVFTTVQHGCSRGDRPSALGATYVSQIIIACWRKAVRKNVQTVTIETPEHFELEFRLAGIGTRFLAFLIDKFIQFGAILALLLIVGFFVWLLWRIDPWVQIIRNLQGAIGQWIIGLALLVYGIVVIGYFLLFEYFWSGATPGKRSQDIRVIRNDGRPISFFDSAVRNILRFFDVLFDVYPIGVVVMFIDFKNRRLGDLAAGTLVIIDKEVKRPVAKRTGHSLADTDEDVRMIVSTMTPMDYRLLSRFLSRCNGLEPEHRLALAEEIRDRIVSGSGQSVTIRGNLEAWLKRVEHVYRERTRVL